MRTLADLYALAANFPPLDPGDKESQLSPHEAILRKLGLVVIGEHEGTERVELYCQHTKKTATLYQIDKLSMPRLAQLCGEDIATSNVHDGREDHADKVKLKDVRMAIADASSSKVYLFDKKIGAGVREVGGHILLVKSMEYGRLNGHCTIERHGEPFFGDTMLDLSRGSPDWCDLANVESLLKLAQDPKWRLAAFREAEDLFSQWYWKYVPSAQILASLVCCSWVQTTWAFRPQVFITGPSHAGKSYLMEKVVKEMFGKLSFYVAKATAAAMRQFMGTSSTVVIVDEFEKGGRQEVLDMFRLTGAGIDIPRGTRDQRGKMFTIKHLPWFGAIETGLTIEQDANRFIILEIESPPPDKAGVYVPPQAAVVNKIGMNLLAIALTCQGEARRLEMLLRSKQNRDIPGRLVEIFAVPCAMISAICGHNDQAAIDTHSIILDAWDFEPQRIKSTTSVLQEILTSEIWLEGGKRHSVSQILRLANGTPNTQEFNDALHRAGIARITKRSVKQFDNQADLIGTKFVFFCSASIRKSLLRPNSEFSGHAVDQYLLRIEGAIRDRQRLGGEQRFSGVSIPEHVIDKLFNEGHTEQDGDYEKEF